MVDFFTLLFSLAMYVSRDRAGERHRGFSACTVLSVAFKNEHITLVYGCFIPWKEAKSPGTIILIQLGSEGTMTVNFLQNESLQKFSLVRNKFGQNIERVYSVMHTDRRHEERKGKKVCPVVTT